MTTINIRVDENVKRQASELFEELGLDMSTAMNLFLRQSIRYGGIPFDVRMPNRITVSSKEDVYAKLKEAEDELQSGAPSISHKEVWEKMRAKYETNV